MKRTILAILLACTFITSQAQDKDKSKEKNKEKTPAVDIEKLYAENVSSIDNIINSLYKAISGEKKEKRNWTLFKFLFYPDAKLITSGRDNERKFQVRYMKPDDYIKSSGKWITDNGFIEKEIHRTVDAFGNMTHVFSTFESFYSKTDDEPFMRGINSIQLLNDGKRWWIINVFWDNESRWNPIPKNYLPSLKKSN